MCNNAFLETLQATLNNTAGAEGCVRICRETPYAVIGTPSGVIYGTTPQSKRPIRIGDYNERLGGLPIMWQNLDSPGCGIRDCVAIVPG